MKLFATLFAMIMLASCTKENSDYKEENEQHIQKYLAANNLVSEKSETGLHYIINQQGVGEHPNFNSNVRVAYKGYFTNGNIFDQSSAQGISFNLQGVIPGWTEGITYFKPGGSGMLLIPSHLGYGATDLNGIPGGSVLIFDVTLLSTD